MILSGVFLLVVDVLILFFIFSTKLACSPLKKGFLLGIFYFLSFPVTVLVLNGRVDLQDNNSPWAKFIFDQQYPEVFILSFALLLISIILYLINDRIVAIENDFDQYSITLIKTEIFIGYVISISILFSFYHITSDLNLKWTEHRDALAQIYGGEFYSIFKIISVCVVFVTSLKVQSLISLTGENFTKTLLYFFLPLFEMFISGNRIYVFSLAVLYLINNLPLISKRRMFIYFLTAIFFLNFLVLWSSIRAFMSDEGFLRAYDMAVNYHNEIENKGDSLMNSLMSMTEGANVFVLLNIIKDTPSHIDFTYFQPYLKIIMIFIPRSFWPNKPLSYPQVVAQLYNPEIDGFSLNSTIFGEGYGSFGILGCIFIFIFCFVKFLFFMKLIRHTTKHDCVLFSNVAFIFSFFSVRYGALSDVFLLLIFCFFCLWMLSVLARSINRHKF